MRNRVIDFGVRLVFVLALGALLTGCGGSAPPPSPEEAEEVVVRVSGTEGTVFSGDYSTLEGDLQDVNGTLEGEPMEYTVEIEPGVSDGVTAFFRKTEPGAGELKAQILADGEVVVESTTYAELGSVIIDWLPEVDILEGDLPEGDLPEGDLPEGDLPEGDLPGEVPPEENPK